MCAPLRLWNNALWIRLVACVCVTFTLILRVYWDWNLILNPSYYGSHKSCDQTVMEVKVQCCKNQRRSLQSLLCINGGKYWVRRRKPRNCVARKGLCYQVAPEGNLQKFQFINELFTSRTRFCLEGEKYFIWRHCLALDLRSYYVESSDYHIRMPNIQLGGRLGMVLVSLVQA